MGSKDHVASPTFTIGREYHSGDRKLTLYHFDFYRLSEPGIMALELDEALRDSRAVIAIEWGSIVEDVLPDKKLLITLTRTGEESRDFDIRYPEELAYLIPENT
jgi:tRNA threonylcarbamoyladenosine biosynthesis protein TsaE